MFRWLLLLLPFLGGLAGGAQAPVNTGLSKRVGILEAAFVSFSVGALAMALLAFALGRPSLERIAEVPRWQLLGGLLGSCYVLSIIVALPRLGAAATIFAGIAGQTIFALLADHYGWLGLERIPFGPVRALGLLLLAAGVLLVNQTR